MLYQAFNWLYGAGETLFWAVIVLGMLIFIHELGHHLAAKKLGIGVSCFSLGFGRRLWGFQWGETDYRLSLIPFGGYVKLLGEEGEEELSEEDRARAYSLRPVHHRLLVIVAGPLFNVFFALFLSWVIHMAGIPAPGTWVGRVLPDSPALTAGLRADDHIVAIDGKSVRKWIELVAIVRASANKRLILKVERARSVLELPITPTSKSQEGAPLGYGRIGISLGRSIVTDRYGPFAAMWESAKQNYSIIHLTVGTIYGMITRTMPADIGGPIRISVVAAEQAKRGLRYLVMFTILLSLNLAVLNLLPIPILDGGHIFFLLFEALRGRPLSQRIQEAAMQVGTVLLVGLMLFATYKDSVYYFLSGDRVAAPQRSAPAQPQKPGAPKPSPSGRR